ncbi:TPA: hypothetical protein EYQ19_00560 [Candidatus Pacearchaeota archaeon]|nr:hypothetical protein [Candidatus Pacearchaeota archaeon]
MGTKKLKKWLINKNNLLFLGILISAIVVRLYYFFITKNQPLWWDEADYLAYAKNLAGFETSWIITAKHNSIYPFLAAVIFKLFSSEIIVKFLLQLLPSILSIILIYMISNEMYEDKRIGVISAFIAACSWTILFNTTRFHIGILGLFTGFLSIYVFWRGYENKKRFFRINQKWAIPISVFLAILTYSIRRGYFLFGAFFIFYLLLTKKWKKLIKEKNNWVGLLIAGILFFLTEKFIFNSNITGVSGAYYHEELPINFLPFEIFSSYFSNFANPSLSFLFYLFWIGMAILLINVLLSIGYIKENSSKETKADIFNLLSIIITLAFFIIVLRSPNSFGEPRWYFPLFFPSSIAISKGALAISDYLKKYHKILGSAILFLLILSGGYYQLKYADSIILSKKDSFIGIKEASLLIKELSREGEKILTLGQPQVEYYSERKTVNPRHWPDNPTLEATLKKIKEDENVKYLLISFSEPGYPEWMAKRYQEGEKSFWEIPFMDTKIDFSSNNQQILREKNFENLNFKLIGTKQEVFIYSINRITE